MSRTFYLALSWLVLTMGCASGGADDPQAGDGTDDPRDGGGGAPSDDEDEDEDGDDAEEEDEEDDDSDEDSGPDKPPAMLVSELPEGFTEATTSGGYQVLGPLAELDAPADNTCVNVLRAIIRDFTQAHVDFGEQKPSTWMAPGLYTGQVLSTLGEDRKPVLDPDRSPLDVIEKLSDWYTNVEDVNEPYVMDFWLEPDATRPGTFVFDVKDFFPLDDFNTHPEDVQVGGEVDHGAHNFLFTTEIHTSFEYKKGQVFSFRGDDDVFVFVNDKLAVDLGGIHGPVEGSVDLDARAEELGLTEGEVYTLDLFQAERNPGGSNFRIDTSLDFKECGILPVDVL